MTEIEDLETQADRAAAAGDIPAARRLLEAATRAAPERIDNWLKLSAMSRAMGDMPAALDAVGQALRVDPLHFLALLSRARLLEAAGRTGEAARAYVRALAQRPSGDVETPALKAVLAHAEAMQASYQDGVAATWQRAIEAGEPAPNPDERRRLDRFASNALRRTPVYRSDPTHYFYPGLTEREFHDRADFPWLAALEAHTDAIRAEFQALFEDRLAQAEPYVQYPADAPVRQWAALNNSMDWTAFHLLNCGVRIAANADRCPRTMEALALIPQPRMARRSPNAMFSLLKPHTRIPPHHGIANTRLVCHLPLVVPEGCLYRVGATQRKWVEGEAFVFDDTIEHEAVNDSDEPRAVLIFDVWHPALSAAERAAVTRMMEAEETEHGTPL